MKKTGLIFVAILLSFLIIGCGQDASSTVDKEIVIKLSHVSSPGSARDLGAHKVKEIVEAETEGRVKVDVYPSSQLGGQRDQVEGVQSGNIEMVVVPTAYLGGTQPLITLLDTPFFLPPDLDDLKELYSSDAIRALLDTTEEVGIKTLSIWHTGYMQYSANRPILKPDDLKGLKVRVMASPILFEQAKTFGADGITMDFSETYSALQSRAIDGQENPIDTIFDMKFHEVQSDISLTTHGTLDQLFLVNQKWFESLDADIQAAIIKGVEEGQKVTVDSTYEAIERAKGIILSEGVNIHEVTPEQRTVFEEDAKPIIEFARNHFGEQGKKLFNDIEAEIKRITGK
ncbi:TRAP transporter substrate-binding protein [Anaerobacillus isosaccharinicus]|uniref:TRAP transporter substrate-binding protein n=1 Tax=Anaerobacillus isosaccharinicus TaxID=1532552 RepID=A0A1S2M398_9BACI|nr:TRAP transporter substrate-binding protein [Anaerobacillus isosaccharinicus]MBA5586444.1 TRAP transporter substrate-binding protein [Anaerobacillus isosaccharinicus]QOY35313.1 TRAP transporter substrate-binding protein [Anaerobacillus isosaccharinicus]